MYDYIVSPDYTQTFYITGNLCNNYEEIIANINDFDVDIIIRNKRYAMSLEDFIDFYEGDILIHPATGEVLVVPSKECNRSYNDSNIVIG